ncbi:MAG: hypothetical protein ABIF01_04590, partial [Candidatus Micrarchaeota archaeon]
MERVSQKTIEEIVQKVAALVRGVTQEQVKRLIENKLENPTLGYRELGKPVGLKKDKVREVWKMAEPMLAQAEASKASEKFAKAEASKVPEKPRDEGELYAEAFSFIEGLWKEGSKAGDIAIALSRNFKLVPDKAEEIVRKYLDLKELDLASLEENFVDMEDELKILKQKFGLAIRHGRNKMKDCTYYNKDDGTCRHWRWESRPDDPWIHNDMVEYRGEWFLEVSEHPEYCATCESLPIGQGVGQLETDMKEVINGL